MNSVTTTRAAIVVPTPIRNTWPTARLNAWWMPNTIFGMIGLTASWNCGGIAGQEGRPEVLAHLEEVRSALPPPWPGELVDHLLRHAGGHDLDRDLVGQPGGEHRAQRPRGRPSRRSGGRT